MANCLKQAVHLTESLGYLYRARGHFILTGKVYNSLFQVQIIPHFRFMQKPLLEATISLLKIVEFPVTHLLVAITKKPLQIIVQRNLNNQPQFGLFAFIAFIVFRFY